MRAGVLKLHCFCRTINHALYMKQAGLSSGVAGSGPHAVHLAAAVMSLLAVICSHKIL